MPEERDMANLAIGNLVEVDFLNEDDPSHFFQGLQGEVVALGTGAHGHVLATIKVADPKEKFKIRTGWFNQPENVNHCIVVHCQDLKLIDEINPLFTARQIFGDFLVLVDTRLLYKSEICIVVGCGSVHVKLAYVNFVGSVYVLPVCDDCHQKHHRYCVESLDIKPPTDENQ